MQKKVPIWTCPPPLQPTICSYTPVEKGLLLRLRGRGKVISEQAKHVSFSNCVYLMVLSLPEYYIIAIACYIYIFWDEWYWNIVFRFYFLCQKIDKNGEPGDGSSKEIEISVKLILTRHLFPPFSIQNMMKRDILSSKNKILFMKSTWLRWHNRKFHVFLKETMAFTKLWKHCELEHLGKCKKLSSRKRKKLWKW